MKLFPLIQLGCIAIAAGTLSAAERVDFNYDIRPILSQKCYHCHGPDEGSREAKLRFDIREEALKERDGTRAIVPGNIKDSELVIRINSTDEDEQMPPPHEGEPLTAAEKKLLSQWIAEGAEYKTHWAWTAPTRPPVPRPDNQVRNPIDAFIRARLTNSGLKPSPEADRHTLMRRLSLDLTGLPPTPEQTAMFVNDKSAEFYEKAVDRLLALPQYGERWTSMWLDLARYADSSGYGSDGFRLNIWPYRDWVIRAFNHNLPYDQFTVQQIAGDLLPNATPDQIAATAFHRNTLTNNEGGTVDEEYRVAAVKDRIATTAQVWMGLTMQCAQCHTHKFDPITHKDYYGFFGVFNQTEDVDRGDEIPTMPVVTEDERTRREKLKTEIQQIETQLNENSPELMAEQQQWEQQVMRPVEWKALHLVEATSESGALLGIQPDQSLLVSGATPEREVYSVKVRDDLKAITAFRLELLPDASLPSNGPGRAGNGNALLSELKVIAAPRDRKAVRGRKIRIEIPERDEFLSLAEVEVFSGGRNIAGRGTTSQSSTDYEGAAGLAVDGNTDGDYHKNHSVTHTRKERSPWWELDLGSEQEIESIVVWNRTDHDHGRRLEGYRVTIKDNQGGLSWTKDVAEPPKPTVEWFPAGERILSLRNASADFSQQDWPVSGAIDGNSKTGWAISPETGKAHAAVFELSEPLGEEFELTFRIFQNYGERHVIGRFRISATTLPPPVQELPAHLRTLLTRSPADRAKHEQIELGAYFRSLSKVQAEFQDQLAQKRQALAAIKSVELPVMRELPADKRRQTHVLTKGSYLAPADKVDSALPAEFSGFFPREGVPDRLAVARWLVHSDNPLTARVAVNRFWAQLLGTGLVETQEDFGTQGSLPTHPELLDWLAVTFRSPKSENPASLGLGWDMKALVKLIVTSATYRQSAQVLPGHLEKDARNRLLARYPRRRLDAEFIRDQSLVLAGLLSTELGGPSVYPPQPDGLWKVAFNGGQNAYPTSQGEDRYRRAVYTFLRRTMPYPSLATFDAPSRETCTVRRNSTNTPLQAFVTLNDPGFVEAAAALARRIIQEGGSDTASRTKWALQLVLGRPPTEQQLTSVQKAFANELANFAKDQDSARKLTNGVPGGLEALGGALSSRADTAETAAWTVIANVLLNLDAVLTNH